MLQLHSAYSKYMLRINSSSAALVSSAHPFLSIMYYNSPRSCQIYNTAQCDIKQFQSCLVIPTNQQNNQLTIIIMLVALQLNQTAGHNYSARIWTSKWPNYTARMVLQTSGCLLSKITIPSNLLIAVPQIKEEINEPTMTTTTNFNTTAAPTIATATTTNILVFGPAKGC